MMFLKSYIHLVNKSGTHEWILTEPLLILFIEILQKADVSLTKMYLKYIFDDRERYLGEC